MMTMKHARLSLKAETAADLMAADPVSLRHSAGFREAVAFFTDRNIAAAPVVDGVGRPIGVLSITDLLIHSRECGATDGEFLAGQRLDPATAGEMMTPTLFTVRVDTAAAEVVRDMLRSNVHHLFVLDDDDAVVGVIGTRDILRHLR